MPRMFDTARPGLDRDHHVDPLPHSGYPDGREPLGRSLLSLLAGVSSIGAFAHWHYLAGVLLAVVCWLAYPRGDGGPKADVRVP